MSEPPAPGTDRDGTFSQVPPPPDGAAEHPPPLGGRLHPTVMAIWPLSQVGPLVFLLVIGTLPWQLVSVLLGISIASSAVRYARFTWRLEGEALVIEQGLLQRRRRVIPLERVQSVDLARKVRHRLFGVVEVRVEAIGGGSTEGRLDALAPQVADEVRHRLLRRAPRAPEQPVESEEMREEPALVRLSPDQLVVAGLTGGRVGVAAAILGFIQQALGQRAQALVERLPTMLGVEGLIGLVAVSLAGAFILSVAATVVTYWDFTLTRTDGALRIRRGLLEQRLDTLPLRRIQAVRVEENLVRRMLGLAAVKVDVAGRGGDEGRETGLLLPLGSRAEAFALAVEVLEAAGLADRSTATRAALEPAPRRARTRRLLRAAVAVALVTAASVLVFGTSGWTALVLVLPTGAAAVGAYRALGHAERPGLAIARSGLFVRRTAYVPTARLQSLALTATPFQRRRRLATVELQIARSPGVWGGPEIVDIDADRGFRLLAELNAASIAPATGDTPATPHGAVSPL